MSRSARLKNKWSGILNFPLENLESEKLSFESFCFKNIKKDAVNFGEVLLFEFVYFNKFDKNIISNYMEKSIPIIFSKDIEKTKLIENLNKRSSCEFALDFTNSIKNFLNLENNKIIRLNTDGSNQIENA